VLLHWRGPAKPVKPKTDGIVPRASRDTETVRSAGATREAGRDYRLDFFRGLALLFIFIDHIPDNTISYFTLRSFAFCDAAEVFIFISGYTAALAYAPAFERQGLAMGIARIYRRVWQLYVAHLCLFMLFNAEVAYTLKFLYNPLFADELQVGDYLNNPGEAFIRVLLLQFQPNLLNILPLYIALLLALPLLILMIRHHVVLGLVPSLILWLEANLFGWNMPGFPHGVLWYFDPFAWQLLFAIGLSLGCSRGRQQKYLSPGGWLPRTAIVFAAVAAFVSLSWTLHEAINWVPQYVVLPETWFDKTMLPPARLLSVLALAVLVETFVPRNASFLTSRLGWLVVLCGQSSLEIFCLSILLAVLANFVLNLEGYGLLLQCLVNLVGLLIMFGVGLLLAWFKDGGRVPVAPRRREAS
jgi:hypothetical protein